MEQDKIIKGYDPVIMRRLLAFIAPYKLPAIVAVAALLVAIIAELATPVIMQRAIDNTIIARSYRLEDAPRSRDVLRERKLLEETDEIGGYLYLSETENEKLSADIKDELEDLDLYQKKSWYLTPFRDDPGLLALLEDHPDLFETIDGYILIEHDRMDSLTSREKQILRSDDISTLGQLTILYFGLLTASLIFMFVQVYLMAFTGQEVMRDIRGKLFGHTIRQSLRYLGKTPVGTLVTRITNDVETINEFFTSVATSILRDFSLMAGVIITMFLLDLRLALITIITLPPVLILTFFFRTRARDAYRRVRMWVSRVNAFLSEHILGMEVVQIFGREKISRADFSQRNQELLKANLSEMMVFAVFRPLINLLTSVSIGTILYFGGRMVLETTVSLGIMIAFVNLINKFYQPVMDFAEK
ncbi:MAG: ABC transporter ATP-binding protein, partial [Spirochaetota bacterium]|nr:ABC transporter ATP-binding protein [Spirochaetota bacterium]